MHEALLVATCIHIVVGIFAYLSHGVRPEHLPTPSIDGASYAAWAQPGPAQAQFHDCPAEQRLSSQQCPIDTAAKHSREEMCRNAQASLAG